MPMTITQTQSNSGCDCSRHRCGFNSNSNFSRLWLWLLCLWLGDYNLYDSFTTFKADRMTLSRHHFCCEARKIDRNQPHAYQSVLPEYSPGPFPSMRLRLSRAEENQLTAGQSVMKQTMPKNNGGEKDVKAGAGGAICVQDVDAPPALVWEQILDLNHYKGKVPKVLTSENYFTSRDVKNGIEKIKTRMVLAVLPGYSYEAYYDHTYYKKHNSMVWKLDYSKTSDFEDVSGHWHVEPHPVRGSVASRVFYACDVKLSGAVPKPILNYISKAALKQATGWVKKESEKVAAQTKVNTTVASSSDDCASSSGVSSSESDPDPSFFRRRFRLAFGLFGGSGSGSGS